MCCSTNLNFSANNFISWAWIFVHYKSSHSSLSGVDVEWRDSENHQQRRHWKIFVFYLNSRARLSFIITVSEFVMSRGWKEDQNGSRVSKQVTRNIHFIDLYWEVDVKLSRQDEMFLHPFRKQLWALRTTADLWKKQREKREKRCKQHSSEIHTVTMQTLCLTQFHLLHLIFNI